MSPPVYSLLGQFNRPQWQWLFAPIVIATVALVYSAVGLGPYSGKGVPPMYGDFEAQRHWMEITQHLPTSKWYFYDLQWWGLDYPPLTAYHSWLCGFIGSRINQEWFALDTSRGFESRDLLGFMRQTVLASEFLVYVPAIVLFARTATTPVTYPALSKWCTLATILLQPSLAIIDNGHFQYNCVFLGLFVLTLNALYENRLVWASVWFVSSLMFKQMSLYYAPVVFFYILGQCIMPRLNLGRLISVGITVIVLFALYLLPFLSSTEQLFQVAFRVFPLARGLWEDKVANFWCASNTVVKWKRLFSEEDLPKLALLATSVGFLPSCLSAFLSPRLAKNKTFASNLPFAFAACSWSFYLFSFQVHEKSVLVPLLPSTLLLLTTLESNKEGTLNYASIRAMVMWVNNIAYYSMWPLLKRDDLALQYFVLFIFWNWLCGGFRTLPRFWLSKLVVACSYSGIFALTIMEYFNLVPLAARFPDLYVLANCSLSFVCFVYFFLWLQVHLF